MVQDGRAAESPVVHLKGGNPKKDRRRIRRAYTVDELRRLIGAANAGDEQYGLPGWVRALLYRLVAEAGLRQNELRTLTVRAVNVEGDRPSVTVRAAYCKVGREDELPLLPGAARDLRRRLDGIGRDAPVFPLPRDRKQVIRMLRKDLDAAGIPYQDEDGRFADFHALRHTFITNLALGGTAPKVAMDLARHSDVNLTMQRYSHTVLEDRARALQALPDLDANTAAEALRATGTDAIRAEATNNPGNGSDISEYISKPLTQGVDSLSTVGSVSDSGAGPRDRGKALKNRDLAAVGSAPDPVDMTADGGTRTHNLSFTKAEALERNPLAAERLAPRGRPDLPEYIPCDAELACVVQGSPRLTEPARTEILNPDHFRAQPVARQKVAAAGPADLSAYISAHPELARVVEAWADLRPASRQAIITLVQADHPGGPVRAGVWYR